MCDLHHTTDLSDEMTPSAGDPPAQRAPDALGCRRHRQIADAERGEGVENGVHHRGRAGDGAALAHTLAPSGLVGLGTGLKSTVNGGKVSARGMA